MVKVLFREIIKDVIKIDNEKLKLIVKTLDKKKASDIKVIRVNDLTILADYFVIVTGTSSTQVKALADEVDYVLGDKGIEPLKVEGYQSSNWIVLDYNDVVVHVFYKDTRDFYSLDKLWSDGEEINIDEILEEEDDK